MNTIEWLLTAMCGGACWELWDTPAWPHEFTAPLDIYIMSCNACVRLGS